MNEVLKRQRRKTMSQKKVDKYKNSKYSRNSALKKERAEFVLEMAAWILIAVLLVGWIGYSAYAKIQVKEASVKVDTVMDTSALTDYISGLSSDSAE
ncbi:hypothetical protein HMPREF1547_00471 [Blautia sp. KLE 1732]|jgi:hypothetical protein|nr:hypothetical protein HMPREF1547_00471 [Blautia sp. KLE 1732]